MATSAAERQRQYRERNKDKPETPRQRELRLASNKRYYEKKKSTEEGREKINETSRRAYHRNPEKHNAASMLWRSKHREECNARRREWRQKNIVARLLYEAQRRARDKGIEFSITIEDIPPMGEACPILGTPFTVGKETRHSPSIDRINPKLGYVPGNVWIIGYRTNLIKNDGTAEEHELIAKAMRERGA